MARRKESKPPEVSKDNRQIHRMETAAFEVEPGQWRVTCYWDDDHVSSVDILEAADRPCAGVTSYATVGLSDTPLLVDGKEYPVRAELVGACASKSKKFPNILSTAAFCIINSTWPCFPGALFPDIVAMYNASKTLKHALLANPFLWEDALKAVDLTEKKVAWLMVVPISEKELRHAEAHGAEALEDLLQEADADVFDLQRRSVV